MNGADMSRLPTYNDVRAVIRNDARTAPDGSKRENEEDGIDNYFLNLGQ
jgi:hypothetical protein